MQNEPPLIPVPVQWLLGWAALLIVFAVVLQVLMRAQRRRSGRK